MKFINTNNIKNSSCLLNAIITNLPDMNGLWFLENIPTLNKEFFHNLVHLDFHTIAFKVCKQLFMNDISDTDLNDIIHTCFNFNIPLIQLNNNEFILECFHGPTLTFKDFGARFMSTLLDKLLFSKSDKTYNILVATSGDTGSAIADAFYEISNVFVHILYPKDKISDMQELQITSYQKNVIAYGIEGSFDDCQHIVKTAFLDNSLSTFNLLSANSINIARLIPQCLYYFYAFSLLYNYNINHLCKIHVSIPCGNCGNLTGAVIAKKMGLPIDVLIACQNDNDTFIKYLDTGIYKKQPSIYTISNAMDVGNPSNFKRLQYIYPTYNEMIKDIKGMRVSHNETIDTITDIYTKYNYILDPHTSVAFCGNRKYIHTYNITNYKSIIIATAHPSKFCNIMNRLNIPLTLHPNLDKILSKKKELFVIENNYHIITKVLFIKNIIDLNIVFIGMPGSGKSTLAEKLYKITNKNYIELDQIIEDRYKLSLIELIKKYGNDKFKEIEMNIGLEYCSNISNTIVSPGGSIIYYPNVMKLLDNDNTLIIYLKTSLVELKIRTNNFTNRGIVFTDDTIEEFYKKRHLLYKKYSHITIDCHNTSPDELINSIYSHFININ